MKVLPKAGAVVEEVDVDTDDALLSRFGSRVPVVISPDGRVLAEGQITRKRLRRALRATRHLGF